MGAWQENEDDRFFLCVPCVPGSWHEALSVEPLWKDHQNRFQMLNPFRNTWRFLHLLILEKLYEGECRFPAFWKSKDIMKWPVVSRRPVLCLVEDGASLLLLLEAELRPSEGTGREGDMGRCRDRLSPRTV